MNDIKSVVRAFRSCAEAKLLKKCSGKACGFNCFAYSMRSEEKTHKKLTGMAERCTDLTSETRSRQPVGNLFDKIRSACDIYACLGNSAACSDLSRLDLLSELAVAVVNHNVGTAVCLDNFNYLRYFLAGKARAQRIAS